MPKLTYYDIKKAENKIEKKLGQLENLLTDSPGENARKNKHKLIKTRIKSAEEHGLTPQKFQEEHIRGILNEKVIYDFNNGHLSQVKLARILRCSRPKISAIMNRKIDNVTIDMLIQILSILGTPIKISF